MTENSGLRFAAYSDIGNSRQVQEDAVLAEPPIFAVADGMGGHAAGDVASQMAIEIVAQGVREQEVGLLESVARANRAIYQKSKSDPAMSGMGTTLTALLVSDSDLQIAHIGDSRAYLLRDGALERLTEDHSVVERMVRQGKLSPEEAAHHPQRSALERALGVEEETAVDMRNLSAQPGDRFLLCSDGLTIHLEDDEIEDILTEFDDPASTSRRLVREAVDAGGMDNVTAIVVDFPGARSVPAMTLTPKKKRARRIAIAGIVLALLLVATLMARAAVSTSWYVGERTGRVAIYKGIPESLGSIELSRVEDQTRIEVDRLPELYQERLKEGIRVATLAEARDLVAELEKLSSELPEVSTTPPGGNT